MGGYYYPRRRSSYGGYGSHERILELILRQGDLSAQSRREGADILGGFVQSLGQQAAQAVDQIGKEKAAKKQAEEMGKRDAAWVSYVESGDWQKDPTAAYTTARKIWGPENGDRQFMALQGVAQLMGEKRNPEADQKSLGGIIGAMDAVQDPARARLYPQALALAKRVYPDLQLGDQYDPSQWAEISAIGKSLRGEKAETPKTREIKRRLPDGSEEISIVEDKPGFTTTSAAEPPKPDTRSLELQMAEAKARGDTATYNRLLQVRKDYSRADDKPPDPGAQAAGDRVADAWASGMAFPSTQEATSAALESFSRRGMPVPRKLGQAMQQEAIRTADTLATIEDVRTLYENVKGKVGPVAYQFSEFNQKLPWTKADPDFAAFNAALRGMGNLEIKRVTGAQMSEAEADRLLKGMATGTLKPEEFEAALSIMERNAKRNRDIILYGRAEKIGDKGKEGRRWERAGGGTTSGGTGSQFERVD